MSTPGKTACTALPFPSARLVPFLALALAALCGCAPRKPNVLLITLDTTRADRIGCYGYTNAVTPVLDNLAAEGARFAHAQTVLPITLPAHTTMLTGLLPPEHGLRVNFRNKLPADIPTIAESFKAAGYRTGAVVAFSVLDVRYGLDKGFDLYDAPALDPETEKMMRTPPQFEHDNAKSPYRRAGDIVDRALAWLKLGPARKPWFLWVHFFDPHYPWHWNRAQVGEGFSQPYDAEVAYMDLEIGRMTRFLKTSGKASDTIIMALGDHGEGLGEHNEPAHSLFIYQTTMHVPLIIHAPGRIAAGQIIREPVSIVQVAPTLLDLAAVPPTPPLRKMWDELKWLPARPSKASRADSLVRATGDAFSISAIDGVSDSPDGLVNCYMESDYGMLNYRWAPLRGIRRGDWKYIRAPVRELYNVQADPQELVNLAYSAESNRIAGLELHLAELEDLMTHRTGENLKLSRAETRIMASMGYLAGGDGIASSNTVDLLSLPDPKQVNPASVWSTHITRQTNKGDFGDKILELARDVVKLSPTTPQFHTQLARILDRRQQYAESLASWDQALSLDAAQADYWNGKALALVKLNREPEALPCFREAYRLEPSLADARQNLIRAVNNVARLAANARQFAIADRLIDEGTSLEPDNPGWELSRAGVRLAAGDRESAIAIIRKTLADNPDYRPAADALKQLGAAVPETKQETP